MKIEKIVPFFSFIIFLLIIAIPSNLTYADAATDFAASWNKWVTVEVATDGATGIVIRRNSVLTEPLSIPGTGELLPSIGPMGFEWELDLSSWGENAWENIQQKVQNLFSVDTLVVLGTAAAQYAITAADPSGNLGEAVSSAINTAQNLDMILTTGMNNKYQVAMTMYQDVLGDLPAANLKLGQNNVTRTMNEWESDTADMLVDFQNNVVNGHASAHAINVLNYIYRYNKNDYQNLYNDITRYWNVNSGRTSQGSIKSYFANLEANFGKSLSQYIQTSSFSGTIFEINSIYGDIYNKVFTDSYVFNGYYNNQAIAMNQFIQNNRNLLMGRGGVTLKSMITKMFMRSVINPIMNTLKEKLYEYKNVASPIASDIDELIREVDDVLNYYNY